MHYAVYFFWVPIITSIPRYIYLYLDAESIYLSIFQVRIELKASFRKLKLPKGSILLSPVNYVYTNLVRVCCVIWYNNEKNYVSKDVSKRIATNSE